MAADIEIQIDVEFDGTGAPTGNALFNGSKYTGVSTSEVGSIERIDGKASTKVWVIHRAIVQDTATVLPSGGTFTIHNRGNQKKITAGPWTKV